MNKKQAKATRRGYREVGQLYWTDEMSAMLRKKQKELKAYRFGMIFALSFAVGVAVLYARAFW